MADGAKAESTLGDPGPGAEPLSGQAPDLTSVKRRRGLEPQRRPHRPRSFRDGRRASGDSLSSRPVDRAAFSFLGHFSHRICMPLSEARAADLLERLAPARGGRALDVGCGKAALLLDLVERFDLAEGVGLDTNPRMLAAARSAARERGLARRLALHDRDGQALRAATTGCGGLADLGPFDAILHLGGPLVDDRVEATLAAIAAGLAPGRRALFGVGFWACQPDPGFARRLGAGPGELLPPDALGPLVARAGLVALHHEVASLEEWDAYESRYLANVEAWAAAGPACAQASAGNAAATAANHAVPATSPEEVAAVLARARGWNADWRAHGRGVLAMAFHVIERPPAT